MSIINEMEQIRICWVEKNEEQVYYGDWQYGDNKKEELLEWINCENRLYGDTKYWLEKMKNKKIVNIIETELIKMEREYLEIVR
jgi:hypothetical protein